MNKLLAILTLDMENIPANFQEILIHEKQVVEEWKSAGILENLFLREEKNGAVFIFNNIHETEARELMQKLPLYALKKSIEYLSLMKQF
jgi:ABC-type sugar transport system ATPase subunit